MKQIVYLQLEVTYLNVCLCGSICMCDQKNGYQLTAVTWVQCLIRVSDIGGSSICSVLQILRTSLH